ncbi:hypothetical protein QCD79_34675, partial [Pseudomonas quasicaspiana]|nr:hypothetical protein [Pseudomonas quasicaspiana]
GKQLQASSRELQEKAVEKRNAALFSLAACSLKLPHKRTRPLAGFFYGEVSSYKLQAKTTQHSVSPLLFLV